MNQSELKADTLSSAEASYTRALTARLGNTRGGWKEGKLKRVHRFPRFRFLSPALPLPYFSFTGVY